LFKFKAGGEGDFAASHFYLCQAFPYLIADRILENTRDHVNAKYQSSNGKPTPNDRIQKPKQQHQLPLPCQERRQEVKGKPALALILSHSPVEVTRLLNSYGEQVRRAGQVTGGPARKYNVKRA
jgi:hypothetical protein